MRGQGRKHEVTEIPEVRLCRIDHLSNLERFVLKLPSTGKSIGTHLRWVTWKYIKLTLRMGLPFDHMIPLAEIYPKKIYMQKD